ncbi:MAG: hypothetical protein WED33_03635, partial [Bacteroidia bacterium]
MKKSITHRIKGDCSNLFRLVILFTFFGNLFLNNALYAQAPGSLDLSFNSQGYVTEDKGLIDVYQKTIVQPDQKILVIGMSWNETYVAQVVVTRYLPNGSLDLSFGVSGSFTYNLDNEALAYDAVLSPEGKIILVGSTTDYTKYRILVIQINADGSLDAEFGENGLVATEVGLVSENGEDMGYGVDLDAAGNIIVCGSSLDENYFRRPVVIRYSPIGVMDMNFGVNGVATIPVTNSENVFDCVAVQPDGKIVASGHYAQDLLFFKFLMVRFNEDGSLDNSFGNNGVIKQSFANVDDEGFSLALRPNGKILVAGFSGTQTYNYNSLLVQYTPQGQLDSSFGTNGVVILDFANFDVAEDVKLLPNGDAIVVGTSGEGPPNAYNLAVWRYKSDGGLITSFGTNGIVQHEIDDYYVMLHSLAIQEDGKLVVAGQARSQLSNNDFIVCRMFLEDPAGFSRTESSSFSLYPNPSRGANQIVLNDSEKIQWEKAEIYSI